MKITITSFTIVSILAIVFFSSAKYISGSEIKVKSKNFVNGKFVNSVPIGIKNILKDWGVNESKIVELDLWEESSKSDIKIAATPARHFSGRGLFDHAETLWCSWTIIGENGKIFFSGDTGMSPDFKEVGEKYGPFDLTFIEIAAYNKSWPDLHSFPEQSVEIHIDLKGKLLVPIHWGTFDMAMHRWDEPIERFVKKADELGVKIITPKIGETVDIQNFKNEFWWESFK